MKHRERDELLKDVLTDEGLESLRAATLERGLATMRRRRRNRVLRAGLLAAVPLLVAALIILRPRPVEDGLAAVASRPGPAAPIKFYPTAIVADAPPVKTISDEDLLALFADHPVGLIGPPGRQELMFFGKPTVAGNF